MSEVRLVVDSRDRLGEGPCWAAAEGRLYWFDIQGRKLRWHQPLGGAHGDFDLPLRASVAAPRAAGGLVLATERGLASFDPTSGAFDLLHPSDLGPGFRSNEGKMAFDGRLWWSRMDEAGGARPGDIYATDAGGRTETVVAGVHIANALAFEPEGRFYYADSTRRTIWRGGPGGGAPSVFATTDRGVYPDGAALDAEGFLWNAQWGGNRLVRYAPDGSIARIVAMPVSQPSSCIFGGPDLSTLYVTSAWDGLSDAERAAQPLAGSLFALEPGVAGIPLPLFRG